jgi:hypothetical protein
LSPAAAASLSSSSMSGREARDGGDACLNITRPQLVRTYIHTYIHGGHEMMCAFFYFNTLHVAIIANIFNARNGCQEINIGANAIRQMLAS